MDTTLEMEMEMGAEADWRTALPGGVDATGQLTTMEEAVGQLEALFLRAQADLSYVSRKMDTEFASTFAEAGMDKLNPHRLLQRVERLAADLNQAQKDSDELLARKKTITAEFGRVLLTNIALTRELQNIAGLPISDETSHDKIIEQHSSNSHPLSHTAGVGHAIACSSNAAAAEVRSSTNEDKENGGAAAKPHHVDRNAKTYTPVTDAELMSLSELVRGRVKVAEVNQVYETLSKHFQAAKDKSPINTQDMTKLGLKITGQSGEAKLKILRALKIVNITKQGVVLA